MIEREIERLAEERRRAIAALPLADASLWLGRPAGFPLAAELDAGQLADEACRFGIRGGLVSHWRGKTVSPQAGNQALGECAASLPERFYVAMTGLPLELGESGPLPGAGAPPASVRAVRVFPKSHEFPLTAWCLGGLCRWLMERKLPLLLWHTEANWADLHGLARIFPELSILVESQPQKIIYHVRGLAALLGECANVSVEISNLANASFAWLVGRYGAERFVFGSFLPMNDPLVPLGMLIDSGLAARDQALIAGDNLRRLVGEAAR